MEYRINREDLQNDLLAETLHALAYCYQQIGAEMYVVGAVARDLASYLLQINSTPRRTADLDVAVMLRDWGQYQNLTDILMSQYFIKDTEKQRFIYKGAHGHNCFMVDIVPFGTIADNEHVLWPPEGSPVMSVRCFEEVMQEADKIVVDDNYCFYLASLSGQFLIKLDAWQDRHLKTKKDAEDMVYILQNVYVAYAMAAQSLPPEIDINVEQFDTLVAGAEWIASDLKRMLTDRHRQYYADMLSAEIVKEENSELINDMIDISDTRHYMLFRRAFIRMSQILAL